MSLKTEYTISMVTAAYDVLQQADDLSPCNQDITNTLTALVKSLSDDYSPAEEREILDDPRIRAIRADMLGYLSKAEGEMEKYWAEHFLSNDDLTLEDVENFWYWDNYEDLVAAELPHMAEEMNGIHAGRRVAFVGAGPLPLTAILLHLRTTGVKVTCVDNDPVACVQAKGLIKKLGLQDSIDVQYGGGADFDYKGHDAVVVASLVPQKDEVVTRIRETAEKDVLIGLRSAERLHTLLYDPVDENDKVLEQCRYLSKSMYDPRVINTTLFYHAEPANAARDNVPHVAKKRKCANCAGCKRIPKF